MPGVAVLYEDALLLAVAKPAGRLVIPGRTAGEPEKRDLALVHGEPPEEVRVDLPISKGRKGRMRPGRPGEEGAKPSATRFRRLATWGASSLGGPFSWVEALPETGRTHQIRVHLLALGTPLHAERLRVRHPADGRLVELHAPLPADLDGALTLLAAR